MGRVGRVVLLLVVGVWLVRALRCSEDTRCGLAPATWTADGLDDETFQDISFGGDGTGDMAYAFNRVVPTQVRFRYRVDGDHVELNYTDGTRERGRTVGWETRARGGRCELRFAPSPFPGDVESVEGVGYSRGRGP
jgi:hypothetical protein